MIDGVHIKKLKKIDDERGFLMEMLRDDDPFFIRFGQVYISACNPGYVKGWHYHKKQTDNFVVVSGTGRILLHDMRERSKTNGESMDIIAGEGKEPVLVSIPPGVAHGFECVGDKQLKVVNCPSEHYVYGDPDEFRIDPFKNEIPVKWNNKKGG